MHFLGYLTKHIIQHSLYGSIISCLLFKTAIVSGLLWRLNAILFALEQGYKVFSDMCR